MMGIRRESRSQLDLAPSEKNNQTAAKVLWLLADEFEFDTDELSVLLDVKPRTIQKTRKDRTLPLSGADRYRRLGLLLGIKKNLEILFPENPEVRRNWLRVPREIFKSKSALDMIRENPVESMAALFTVRRILDMQRNGTIAAAV